MVPRAAPRVFYTKKMRAIIVLLLTVGTAVCVSGWCLEEEVVDLRWPNCTERIKTYARDEQQYCEQQYWFNDNCDSWDSWDTFFNYTGYVRQINIGELTKQFPPPVGYFLYFPTKEEIAHINWTIN